MAVRSTSQTWGSVTRSLHWLSAVVVLGLLAHGWWMTHWALRPDRQWNYATHAMIAIYFALVLVIRILWRATEATPVQPAASPSWQSMAAGVTHLALYVLLSTQLITGFLMWLSRPQRFAPATADIWNFRLFGIFDMRGAGGAADKAVSQYWEDQHVFVSHLVEILVAVHIVAALWHHFVTRDVVLSRMASGRHDGA